MYIAIIAEVIDGHVHNYDLGIYDSYIKAKAEVTEYVTRQYVYGVLRNRVLIPTVAKYVINGGLVDEWSAKDLYNNDEDDRR